QQGWRCAMKNDRAKLFEIAELAAAFRGTSEFALESSQQGGASLTTLCQVWPDSLLDWISETLRQRRIQPALAVVLGVRSAKQGIPASMALAAFLQSYMANLVTAGVRLV